MMWLKIDVGWPHVPQHGLRIECQMAVSMVVKHLDAHGEDCSLPYGTVVAVPPSPRVMRKYHGTICNSFQKMWRWLKWMSKGASQCWCPSRLPGDGQGTSDETLGDGVLNAWRFPGGGRDILGLYNYCTEDDRNHMRVSEAVLTRMSIRRPCSAIPDDLHKILDLLLM